VGRRPAWLLAALFAATLPLVNPYVRGDGNGYYAYVRSAVIDGDLRFENEFRHGDPAFRATVIEPDGRMSPSLVLPRGYIQNQWAVGPSILWTPAFLLGHGLALGLGRLGVDVPADGYSAPYRWLCALATAGYAFAGLALACAAAGRLVGSAAAVAATIGAWLGSPLPVYMYFLPFHVPALSSFAVSLFVWYWLRTRGRRGHAQWALWGLAGGLMVEVYYLNAACLSIAGLELARHLADRERRGVARALSDGALFAGAGLVALAPHFAVKWIVHGSPFTTGYQDHFFWGSPRLWQVAFASEHGMFLWTPVLLVATAGLVLLWRRDRWVAACAGLVFAAYYYAVASYESWHGQSAFGNRFFVSLTPLFVLGLAAALSTLAQWPGRARRPVGIWACLLAPLILWNAGLMFQWGTGLMPNRGPVDVRAVARDQVTRVPGLALAFLGRYLGDRAETTREVERRDLERVKTYQQRR
jgi:hypothetical protein